MSELRDSLIKELGDIYDAEQQLLKALPKMAQAASSSELKEAVEGHLRETEGQIERLKEIFEKLEQPVKSKPCKAMQGLIAEAEQGIKDHDGDAALIAMAQKIERLKEVFEKLEQPVKSKPCKAMQGLIAEAEQGIKDHDGDAALIAMAQKIEHYEIASYGTLRSWASLLEEEDISDLLADTLDEEKGCDEQLTEIAESTANIEAAEDEAADMEEDEEEEESAR